MILNFTKVIIAECSNGQKKDGVQNGGKYICDKLNINYHDKIDFSKFNNIDDNTENNGYFQVSNLLQKYNKNNDLTLLLGGDHSLGISSIDAFLDLYKDELRVLWIDAHADINDHLTSLTGNLHGMPIGYHHISRSDKPIWRTRDNRLKSNQLYYFGLRDVDPEELKLIAKENIGYSRNLQDNLADLLKFIDDSKYLMISFDVDSLDPTLLDSTGVLADKGLISVEVFYIIKNSIEKNKLIHLDIMEFNPNLGDPIKSIDCIKKILL